MKKLAMLLAAPVAIVLSLSACSSSKDSSDNTTGDAPGATGTPINIGTIGVYSGPTAQSSLDGKYVMQAWASAVNAAGGIDGHPVKLTVVDTAGNPATGLTQMKSLVEKNKVAAIVGPSDSNPTWASYVDSKNVPVIGGGQLGIQYLTDPNWYPIGGNLLSVFAGIAGIAVKQGPTMGMMYCSEVPGCAAASKLLGSLGKPQGLTVPVVQAVSASTSDFTAQCEALKSAGVGSWDLSVSSALIPRFVAACKQLGFDKPLIEPGTGAGSQLAADGGFNGVTWVDGWAGFFENSTPATKEMQDAIKKYQPQVGTKSVPLNSVGAGAWLGGKLLEAAVKASGATSSTPITSDVLKQGLYALKGETLGGMSPPLTFVKDQPTLINCYFVYTMKDNKYQNTDNLKPSCVDDATSKLITQLAATFKK